MKLGIFCDYLFANALKEIKMFYPVESLRRGGRFYLCWVADSWPLRFATITHRQLWSQDIREICNDLLEVMRNESGRPTNRFSLRLSSQLLRGLVRLYQRKVTVFVGDLCMINAHVMKSTHKKSDYEESEPIVRRSELPRFILELQPEEEAVEDKIQNSGNIVAHIEDITLKESTLPENRIVLDDGFGELNQPTQVMLRERSVEMMLYKETSVQHSALDLPLDFSTDKSHDKSRLNPREAQMERLSEHDISVFGKSMGEAMVPGDFEKEIPEILELPDPDPPHTDKELEKDKDNGKEIEKSKHKIMSDEIVLEELEDEPQMKRRKLRNKLIIDKKIKLSSDYIRSRIADIYVETRPEVLPAPPGPPARPLGAALTALMRDIMERRLHTRAGDTHTHAHETVLKRKEYSDVRTILEKIDEEVVVETYEGNLELQDVSKQMDITSANVQDAPEPCIVRESTDLADLPTQKLLETSQAEKRVSEEQQSPKRRRSGYVTFRHSRQKSSELSILESNKENIPQVCNSSVHLTTLLQRHGLADSETTYVAEEVIPERVRRTTGVEGQCGGGEGTGPGGERHAAAESLASETPLGSLDRTKVSLGDSDNTTDSKKFIRFIGSEKDRTVLIVLSIPSEEWGTQGAMHKIYRCIKSGASPVNVDRLVSSGPVISGHRRVIAARCFTSILKLKQHGFIRIYKDSKTYEIRDIKFGSKIIHDQ